jgi:hypothetical protein
MQALSQGGYDTIDDLCTMPDEEIKELAVIQEDETVKAVPKKSWKILLHTMMWRDWTSHQKPVADNQRMVIELTVHTFELFQENHLLGMIRGTKSGRTSSGMDVQEGSIVTSSHVTEFARGQ